MSELLSNMKRFLLSYLNGSEDLLPYSIKLYAWEYAFMRKILTVRNDMEVKMLRKIGIATVSSTLF